MEISEDSWVLIYRKSDEKWLVKVNQGRSFYTNYGTISFSELLGKPFGLKIRSNDNLPFYILKPIAQDYALLGNRKTNIIHPKDAGLILLNTGIKAGSQVLESGAGSGALSTILANAVYPDGHVHIFEIRDDFVKLASKNISRAGFSENVTIYSQDIKNGTSLKNLDAIILDLGEPWEVIKVVTDSLASSGILASYSPTIDQVMKTVETLGSLPYIDVNTVECLTREILVRPSKTRPNARMVGHTGYLTFARRIKKKLK
ncbi:MAG: tRNA (adenine-N1)-methyltransferase [Candidatus Ranarchaeia archaeon]